MALAGIDPATMADFEIDQPRPVVRSVVNEISEVRIAMRPKPAKRRAFASVRTSQFVRGRSDHCLGERARVEVARETDAGHFFGADRVSAFGENAEMLAVQALETIDLPAAPFFELAEHYHGIAGQPEKAVCGMDDGARAERAPLDPERLAIADFASERVDFDAVDPTTGGGEKLAHGTRAIYACGSAMWKSAGSSAASLEGNAASGCLATRSLRSVSRSMSSRALWLTFSWGIAAITASRAEEGPASQPSRVALYQRDVVSRGGSRSPARVPAEDWVAALRRRLFRQPELAIVPSPPRIAPRAAALKLKEAPLPRPIAVTPAQPLPLAVPPLATPGAERELALQPTSFTPYDRYLGVVREVIANVHDSDCSVGVACRLMREAHSFRYVGQDPYRANSPAVTAARRAGDCKSKALWLYDRLGDPGALYVIGKIARRAKSSHAWVYWRYQSRWWILDPTNLSTPIAADTVSPGRYVPYYSLGKNGTYRHPATQLLLATTANLSAQAPVASRTIKRSSPAEKRRKRR